MHSVKTMRRLRTLRLKRLAAEKEIEMLESMPSSPLRVEARPMLVAGQLAHDQEAGQAVIRVDNHHTDGSDWPVTLWHEVIHLLRMAGDFSQDEDDVERYAKILAITCPEIVDWVGLSKEKGSGEAAES